MLLLTKQPFPFPTAPTGADRPAMCSCHGRHGCAAQRVNVDVGCSLNAQRPLALGQRPGSQLCGLGPERHSPTQHSPRPTPPTEAACLSSSRRRAPALPRPGFLRGDPRTAGAVPQELRYPESQDHRALPGTVRHRGGSGGSGGGSKCSGPALGPAWGLRQDLPCSSHLLWPFPLG